MFRFLIKLLCLFGAHRWVNKTSSIRVCNDCGKQQMEFRTQKWVDINERIK